MLCPLASSLLALSACNALTGASELSTCPACDEASETDASVPDGERPPEAGNGDGTLADARDSATTSDASTDADADADADAAIGADSGPLTGCLGAPACVRVMFATSAGFTGNLGGIAGADAKCQALANASTNNRIKGRAFLAWVSTGAAPVATRMVQGTQAYVNANGSAVAFNFSDLTDGSLLSDISVDELGGNRKGAGAWTGTSSVGAGFSGNGCTDWTAATAGLTGDYGNVGGSGSGWSSLSLDDCSALHSLYCVEK